MDSRFFTIDHPIETFPKDTLLGTAIPSFAIRNWPRIQREKDFGMREFRFPFYAEKPDKDRIEIIAKNIEVSVNKTGCIRFCIMDFNPYDQASTDYEPGLGSYSIRNPWSRYPSVSYSVQERATAFFLLGEFWNELSPLLLETLRKEGWGRHVSLKKAMSDWDG